MKRPVRSFVAAVALAAAASSCASAHGVAAKPSNGTPGCRVEQSQTVEGYEVIFYPFHAVKVPTGFAVPCPK